MYCTIRTVCWYPKLKMEQIAIADTLGSVLMSTATHLQTVPDISEDENSRHGTANTVH